MIVLSKNPSKNKKVAKFGPDKKTPAWPYVYTITRAVGPTCPIRCGFHPIHDTKDSRAKVQKKTCYARRNRVNIHQRRAQPDEEDGPKVRQWLSRLPPGAAVRGNVAGGIAKDGDKLDWGYLNGLIDGFTDRPDLDGWLYTHVEKEQWLEVQNLAPSNLAINWSCDSLAEAQAAQEEGHTGLTCVISKEQAVERIKGLTVCVEQTSGIPCVSCRLCFNDKRKTIVGFIAH